MEKQRRLAPAVIALLIFFAVTSPPHTVHHGLDAVDLRECPVLAASDQLNGELPNDLSLNILLPSTDDSPIFHQVAPEKPAYRTYRNRAPPFIIPA